jgi:putative phosphoribosyl transferase
MKTAQPPTAIEHPVKIAAGQLVLDGNLVMPPAARAIVLFAHGSGSSRFSPRNRFVAQVLSDAGLATLLFDLLTPDEEALDLKTRQFRFDIALLAQRLVAATDWVVQHPDTAHLRVGYFGSSTGAAAALFAAAERPAVVGAIVSRGGRPDLAVPVLHRIQAPTLLIVGQRDTPVIELNRQALSQLHAQKQLTLIPGATHLFEEPGTLEQVARLAQQWFTHHLAPLPIS